MESTAARQAGPSAWTGRIEDDALLRGAGRFGDDVKPEGALAAYFVRSPHAFAAIEHIDVTAAKNAPGVVAVLTAADLAEAHYHSISHPHPIPGRGGKVAVAPHRPSLADKRVLHVGEPVAMVVAVSAQAAQEAGEKIAVDYRPLDAVTDVRAADCARRAAALAGGARQYRLRLERARRSRRQEASRARSRLQGGRACGARRTRQPAPGGRLARAAHGDRELRRRHEAVHPALRHARRRRRARPGRRRHGDQAGRAARAHRRSRRRLRHEGLVLSRIRADAARRTPPAKADPLGLDPLGGLRQRQPGPRLVLERGTGAQPSAAGFSACASTASAMSAPTSPASLISSSPRISRAACRPSTTSRTRR